MPGSFGNNSFGTRKVRRYPADYLILIGFQATAPGHVRRCHVPVWGGTATGIDLGLFAQKPGEGPPQPGALLATASGPGMVGPVEPAPAYVADVGGEGSESAPPPLPGLTISKVTPSIAIPAALAFTYEAESANGEPLGTGVVEASFVSHRGSELPATYRSFYFLTGLLGPALGPAEGDTELEGEPIEKEGEEGARTGTWTAKLDRYDPRPAGTSRVVFTQTSGEPNECSAFGARFLEDESGIFLPVPGKAPKAVFGEYTFVGLIPRGGNLELPVTGIAGGGALRHKAAGKLEDNPAVSGAAEGGAGEDGGLALIEFGVPEIPGML